MELIHNEIVKGIVKKYSKDKNVIGIYLFGSLVRGKATKVSDIDIEIIFHKRNRKYQIVKKKILGVDVDLSLYGESQFIKKSTYYPYLMYSALNYKILYDPQKITEKVLKGYNHLFFKKPENIKILEK